MNHWTLYSDLSSKYNLQLIDMHVLTVIIDELYRQFSLHRLYSLSLLFALVLHSKRNFLQLVMDLMEMNMQTLDHYSIQFLLYFESPLAKTGYLY